MKRRIYYAPFNGTQQVKQGRKYRWRVAYLVKLMTEAQRQRFEAEKAALAKAHAYPPHHKALHIANQGCLLCQIEIEEELLRQGGK